MDVSDFRKFGIEKVSSNRSFGLIVGVGIAVLSFIFRHQLNVFFISFLTLIAVSLVALAFLASHRLTKLNRAWYLLGVGLGKVVTPLVLAVIFFGLFMPFGMLLKAINKLQFKGRFSEKEATGWIDRDEESQSQERIRYQF